MKRLVVGVFVSALAVFGVAPAASAAPKSDSGVVVKVAKAKKVKPVVVAPIDGGFSTQRIDWD